MLQRTHDLRHRSVGPVLAMGLRYVLLITLHVTFTADAECQYIPEIGGCSWVYNGTGADTNYSNDNILFWSLTHLPAAGVLIGAANTRLWWSLQNGAVVTLDDRTGAVLHIDTLCLRGTNPDDYYAGIRSAWINDSGTVMCYTCLNEHPTLVEYPSFREIEDTVLSMRGADGRWFWFQGRVSSTGRYILLYQRDVISSNTMHLWLYDRVTKELVANVGRSEFVSDYLGERPEFVPQFSADDRLLATRIIDTVIVYDVQSKAKLASIQRQDLGQDIIFMLSYSGDHLLVTTNPYHSGERSSSATIYDTHTMTIVWSKTIRNYASLFSQHRGAITRDGKEVIIEEVVQTDTGLRRGYFLYVLPDTTPRGYIFPMPSYWLQPKTPNSGYSGGYPTLYMPPLQHTWSTVNTVKPPEEQPLLAVYPNPTTGEVMVNVGACTSGTWSVRISDGVGRDAPERTEVCSDEILRMDLSAFPAGQYYLRLTELETGRTLRAVALLIR